MNRRTSCLSTAKVPLFGVLVQVVTPSRLKSVESSIGTLFVNATVLRHRNGVGPARWLNVTISDGHTHAYFALDLDLAIGVPNTDCIQVIATNRALVAARR